MKRAAAIVIASLLAACMPTMGLAAAPAWSLLPQPVGARMTSGRPVTVVDGDVVAVHGTDRRQALSIAKQFTGLLANTRGLHLRVATKPDAHAVVTFTIDPHADVVGDAGYRIVIGDGAMRVGARTPRGAYYGSVTAWQLLTPPDWKSGNAAVVAAGVVNDHPRFAWRALLLDSGRHFQSVADIKRLIDWMSLDKLNVLVWHLTEDQGWRLAIPKYPELVKTGACRKAVGRDIAITGSADKPYCGFYTAADVRDIVRYADAHFVTVVPGIDLPGHAQAAVASYPWLGVTGQRPPVWTNWGVSPWLLNPDARTLQLVRDVLDEVMRLFPSRYISIGGDEADKQQWNASPQIRAQMHALGLANMDQLQGWFTRQVADHLVKHGRIPVGWDDELVAGATLPASEVVMSWHGNDHERVALAALRQGHDVVLTPQESLYFDHYQSTLPDEWPGQAPLVSLQQAYDTAVVPVGATAAEATHVLGVQAGLWAELLPNFARIQHALFPRSAALAELGWSPAATHDWQGFLARMPAELARYRALGIGYADSAFAPAFAVTPATHDGLRVTLSNQTGFGTIRYTIDGSAPTTASNRYTGALIFPSRQTTRLRAATFAPDGFALSAPRAQRLNAATLLGRDGNALATCSGNPATRLGSDAAPDGTRPVYVVDIGNMCWRWPRAPVAGATKVAVVVGRVAWRFGDEASGATVRAKHSPAGEIEIHADSCTGPLLARLPLAPAVHAAGETTLQATVAVAPKAGAHDLCLFATGDPRDGQWTLASIRFSK